MTGAASALRQLDLARKCVSMGHLARATGRFLDRRSTMSSDPFVTCRVFSRLRLCFVSSKAEKTSVMRAAVVIALLSTQVAAFQLPRYRTSLRTIRAAEPAPVTDVALTGSDSAEVTDVALTGSVDVAVEVCAMAGGRAMHRE